LFTPGQPVTDPIFHFPYQETKESPYTLSLTLLEKWLISVPTVVPPGLTDEEIALLQLWFKHLYPRIQIKNSNLIFFY
jgi:hypothetical protein